ncbi:MAG: hypothetical protein AAF443_00570 [Chlamydiota bacterium]
MKSKENRFEEGEKVTMVRILDETSDLPPNSVRFSHFDRQLSRLILIFLLLPSLLLSRHRTYNHLDKNRVPFIPWFTGPLLAPTPVNMKPGHPMIQPILTFKSFYGKYDSRWNLRSTPVQWTVNPSLLYELGITDRIGLEFFGSLVSNFSRGATVTDLEDVAVSLGLQIANDVRGSWIPDLRLKWREIFPTGSYRNLNPEKFGIDATGEGSFQTGFLLAGQKLIHLEEQFLSLRWSFSYLFPSSVHVKGVNAYGGGPGTDGTVRPGQRLELFFSGQYTFNQNWVFAFDTFFQLKRAATFFGTSGENTRGDRAQNGLPLRVQLSFSPQIEYNFSARLGILWGVWASLLGKNTPAFAAGFFSLVYIW